VAIPTTRRSKSSIKAPPSSRTIPIVTKLRNNMVEVSLNHIRRVESTIGSKEAAMAITLVAIIRRRNNEFMNTKYRIDEKYC